MAAGGNGNGTLMQATVIDHVTPAMRIYAEESFGPVVTIVRVNGDEEALRLPTTPSTAFQPPFSAAIFSGPGILPSASKAASATSTAPPFMTSRRCLSEE